jgi:hypothetical protein
MGYRLWFPFIPLLVPRSIRANNQRPQSLSNPSLGTCHPVFLPALATGIHRPPEGPSHKQFRLPWYPTTVVSDEITVFETVSQLTTYFATLASSRQWRHVTHIRHDVFGNVTPLMTWRTPTLYAAERFWLSVSLHGYTGIYGVRIGSSPCFTNSNQCLKFYFWAILSKYGLKIQNALKRNLLGAWLCCCRVACPFKKFSKHGVINIRGNLITCGWGLIVGESNIKHVIIDFNYWLGILPSHARFSRRSMALP